MLKRVFTGMACVVAAASLSACTQSDCLMAADEAHATFLEEVAANPSRYSPDDLSKERLTYAAARLACKTFARPVIK